MNFRPYHRPLVLALALAGAGAAHAQSTPVIPSPGMITNAASILGSAAVITFNGWDNLLTTGPINIGAEVGANVLLSSAPNARLGASEQDLGNNGLWGARFEETPTGDGNFLASAFIATRGEFGFTFDTGVSAVGGYFNQFQGTGVGNTLTFLAYDRDGNVIDLFTYRVDTDAFGYNEGQFLGFQHASADIYGFGIADGTFVVDNLTYTAPVPEPGTIALMLAGLGAVGFSVRRRRG